MGEGAAVHRGIERLPRARHLKWGNAWQVVRDVVRDVSILARAWGRGGRWPWLYPGSSEGPWGLLESTGGDPCRKITHLRSCVGKSCMYPCDG